MTLPETERTDPGFSSATTILELNEAQPIGDRIFFFRNRQGDQILLDVIIPEIDPQYAYPHRIRLSEVREGVEVAGQPNFESKGSLPIKLFTRSGR